MSTESYLAQFGVTMQQARDFIASNISNPGTIFQVCKNAGLTNSMLAEIVGGVSAAQVQQFFYDRGFPASQLDASSTSSSSSSQSNTSSNLPTGLINLTPKQGSGSLSVNQLNFIAALSEASDFSQAEGYSGSYDYSENGMHYLRVYVDLYQQDKKDVLIALTDSQLQQVNQRIEAFDDYFSDNLATKYFSSAELEEIYRIENAHPDSDMSQFLSSEMLTKISTLEGEMHQLCSNIAAGTYQLIGQGQSTGDWLVY